jgi:uncharacterized protein (DUF1800 family)
MGNGVRTSDGSAPGSTRLISPAENKRMKFLQGPLTAALSVSLAAGSTPGIPEASRAADRPTRPAYRAQIQGDQRVLQALNRFTFGPRPADVDAVRAEGVDRWFDQQLHPATIDNAALTTRLQQFPAMQWSAEELLYRLPSNAVIRQVIAGKIEMPQSGVLHTVYANQVARIDARRQAKQTARADASIPDPEMQGIRGTPAGDGQMMAANAPAIETDPTFADAVLALPPGQRMMRLEGMQQPQLDEFLKALKGPERQALVADMTPDEKLTVQALEGPERAVAEELIADRLTRDIYSNAQLQEVMTDFWLNHFNVYLRKNETMPYYLVSYERDTIRPRSLGRFEDLLEAVAHSPAMLEYLDNAESIGPDSTAAERAKTGFSKNRKAPEGLNENYARELMELHTLGVNGGYTQADVIQAARILTGWGVDRPQRGGGFQFNENRHEPGAKKVMGQKFKEQGEREGQALLHLLATRPATAKFLSRELAMRFVSDDPPQALVDWMAQAYMKSGGDIATVLRTMERSPEFWSQDAYRAKVKTPLEYVVSAARASGADVENFQPLTAALRQMGMPVYECVPPTGYKWDAADWVSTGELVNRMNFALSLAANRLPGIKTAWSTPASETTPESEEARLETMLVGGGVSETTRSAALEQFEQQKSQAAGAMSVAMNAARRVPAERQNQLLAGLLLGSPEFQRR